MSPTRAFCLAFLAAPLSAFAGDTLPLESADDSSKADLDQCAAALTKRLASFGLKGLKAATAEKDGKRTVEVTSADTIDADTRGKIELLALYPAQNPAMRFGRDLTADEKAQGFDWPKAKDVKTAKCPKGSSWSECLGEDFKTTIGTAKGGGTALLKDQPWISWSDVSVVDKGSPEWTFKISPAATKVAGNEATGGVAGRRAASSVTRIAFDSVSYMMDVRISLVGKDKGSLREGTFTLPAALAQFMESTMRFPMPKGLKPAAAPAK